MKMTESEKKLYLEGSSGLAPYLRMQDKGMPQGKVNQIAWLLLNGSGCGFCKVCRDEPCNIKDGEKCTTNIANYIREIVKAEQQPKTDWIPCEVEMPKEHDSIFAKLKGTDKWKSSMFEKVSDVVNVTIEDQNGKGVTVHACTTDGKWSCDLLRVNKLYRVTAWQPLPAPYKKEGAE